MPSQSRTTANSAGVAPSSAGRRPRPRWLVHFCLLLAQAVVCLVVVEVAIRLFIPVRNVGPSFTVFDQRYGETIKKSFSCSRITPEFTIRFSSNSLGFRGPEPLAPLRGCVLFLGDSFTMGYGVNDGEEFPQLVAGALQERVGIQNAQVVNAGIGGVGNGRWIRFLRTEAPALEPRAVVLQLCSNDHADNENEQLFLLDAAEELVELPFTPSAGWKRRLQSIAESVPWLNYSYLVCKLREIRGNSSPVEPTLTGATPASDTSTPAEKLTLKLVDEAISICEQHRWIVIVLGADLEPGFVQTLGERCGKRGVTLLCVPSREQQADLYFSIDGHWNASGHAYAARILTKHLLEETELFTTAVTSK